MENGEQQWVKATSKRSRDKNSPEGLRVAKKQTIIRDYWLCKATEIPTANSFEQLSQVNTPESEEQNKITVKENKAPPIFVCGVQNIKPLQELLDEKALDCYTLEILNNN